jgi:hypothetical protein
MLRPVVDSNKASSEAAMTKMHILAEIRRTADANGSRPLGLERFFEETGIKKTDWYGKYWARWGDAIKEAGFVPNQMQDALEVDAVVLAFVKLIRRLGRFPVDGELRLQASIDPGFPAHSTFRNRLGPKANRFSKIVEFCRTHDGHEDVAAICEQVRRAYEIVPESNDDPYEDTRASADPIGFVYMLKSGRNFKIGRTNAVGRRERELSIQLPETAKLVHEIRTDDPIGIEAYWHSRFQAKRKNGEWFELNPQDVKVFKRRKFM